MAIQEINIGTAVNDDTGDNARVAFGKINDNFAEVLELISNGGGGGVVGFQALTFTPTGKATTELIGEVGEDWIVSGQAFTASWQLGPPDSASVDIDAGGTGFPVDMTSPAFTGSEANTVAVTYPDIGEARTFTLTGVKDTYPDATKTFVSTFENKKWYGLGTTFAPTDAEYRALALSTFATAYTTPETVLVLSEIPNYIHFVCPSRLAGNPVFKINGFVTGFTELDSASFDNGNGYLEEYRKFRSPLAYTSSDAITFEVL